MGMSTAEVVKLLEKNKITNVGKVTPYSMGDLCLCGILKEDCTHPNCPDDKPKVCPACNQEPCTCVSECGSVKHEKFYFKFS